MNGIHPCSLAKLASYAVCALVAACGSTQPPDPSARDATTDEAIAEAGADGATARERLEGIVLAQAQPLVNPNRAPDDMEHTVGMVVAALDPDAEGVFGIGSTEEGRDRPPTRLTIYQIGSVTKALTGLLLAALAERGEVRRDATLGSIVYELSAASVGSVTLQQLASHRGGLPLMPSNLPEMDPLAPAAGYTDASLLDYLLGAMPQSVGTYRYSNAGVGALGLALRRTRSDVRYDRLLEQVLLSPAGIVGIWGTVDITPLDAAGPRPAQGYARRDGRWVPGRLARMGALAPAGEATANGEGMLALLRTLTGRAAPSLQPAIQQALQPLGTTDDGAEIGLGLEIRTAPDGGRRYEKGGTTLAGFSAYLAFRRDPPVGVAVLTNASRFQQVQAVARAILTELEDGQR